MNQPTNICPLIERECAGERCAWWNYLAGACCMAAGAEYIRDVADGLEDLYQQRATAASAANTDGGRVEQGLDDAVSASYDNGK